MTLITLIKKIEQTLDGKHLPIFHEIRFLFLSQPYFCIDLFEDPIFMKSSREALVKTLSIYRWGIDDKLPDSLDPFTLLKFIIVVLNELKKMNDPEDQRDDIPTNFLLKLLINIRSSLSLKFSPESAPIPKIEVFMLRCERIRKYIEAKNFHQIYWLIDEIEQTLDGGNLYIFGEIKKFFRFEPLVTLSTEGTEQFVEVPKPSKARNVLGSDIFLNCSKGVLKKDIFIGITDGVMKPKTDDVGVRLKNLLMKTGKLAGKPLFIHLLVCIFDILKELKKENEPSNVGKYDSILTPDEFVVTLIKYIRDEIALRDNFPPDNLPSDILEFKGICDRILIAAKKEVIHAVEKKPIPTEIIKEPISTEKIIPKEGGEEGSKSASTIKEHTEDKEGDKETISAEEKVEETTHTIRAAILRETSEVPISAEKIPISIETKTGEPNRAAEEIIPIPTERGKPTITEEKVGETTPVKNVEEITLTEKKVKETEKIEGFALAMENAKGTEPAETRVSDQATIRLKSKKSGDKPISSKSSEGDSTSEFVGGSSGWGPETTGEKLTADELNSKTKKDEKSEEKPTDDKESEGGPAGNGTPSWLDRNVKILIGVLVVFVGLSAVGLVFFLRRSKR